MPVNSKAVPVGSKAPDFTLLNWDGTEVSLSDYNESKCVILVFLRGFQ